MKLDDLDQILRNQGDVTPSPKFLHEVMRAVYQEADTPKPIPFPWTRALPGFAVTVFALCLLCVSLVQTCRTPEPALEVTSFESVVRVLSTWYEGASATPGGWITAASIVTALLITFASLKVPMRFFAEKT